MSYIFQHVVLTIFQDAWTNTQLTRTETLHLRQMTILYWVEVYVSTVSN